MKYIYLAIATIFFGCNSNKKVVNYLNGCKQLEKDSFGFVIVNKTELTRNLKDNEFLRYVGSNEGFNYFVHYYDKTMKIQTLLKLEDKICGIKRLIDLENNILYEKQYGKYADSYYVKIKDLDCS